MNLCLRVAIVAVTTLLCQSMVAQVKPNSGTATGLEAFLKPLPGEPIADVALVVTNSGPATQTNTMLSLLQGKGRVLGSQNAARLRGNLAFAGQLKPGVYETKPYTCIVVVPGPHPDDDAMCRDTGSGTSGMPSIKPDLQFIPRNQKQK